MVCFHRPKDRGSSRAFIPFLVMSSSEATIYRSFGVNCGLINLFNRTLVRVFTNLIMLVCLVNLFGDCKRVFLYRRVRDFLAILGASKNVSAKACFRRSVTRNSVLLYRSTRVSSNFRSCTKVAIRLFRPVVYWSTILPRGKRGIQDCTSNRGIRREGRIIGFGTIISYGYLRGLRTSATT